MLIAETYRERLLKLCAKTLQTKNIATQEELAIALRQEGYDVTQATVSRDIKELALIKVNSTGDQYRYAKPGDDSALPDNKLRFMLKEFVVNYAASENLLVIHTAPGNANAVASAIDKAQWKYIIGTIAGDDTIVLIVQEKDKVADVIECLKQYLD